MIYEIEIKPSAKKQLDALPSTVIRRAEAAIDALAQTPRPSGVKKLKGYKNRWRVRVSDDRIIYEIEDTVLRVLVVYVLHRSEAY